MSLNESIVEGAALAPLWAHLSHNRSQLLIGAGARSTKYHGEKKPRNFFRGRTEVLQRELVGRQA